MWHLVNLRNAKIPEFRSTRKAFGPQEKSIELLPIHYSDCLQSAQDPLGSLKCHV